MEILGRKREKERLDSLVHSKKPELIAVYGRSLPRYSGWRNT
jgi:hypothetical protein